MSKKFYIADWHYGHAHALDFDNRPFKTVDEMNAALVERWNAVVQRGDIVYILGDMFFRHPDPESILIRLKGQKHLIIQPHKKKSFRFGVHK